MSKIRVVNVVVDRKNINMAFDWSSKVSASMLSSKYNTRSCVTFDGELYACKCSCKASGDDDSNNNSEQHAACIHILPNVMKLSMTLTDYIADHLCRELDNMFRTNTIVSKFSENEIKNIEQSMKAATASSYTRKDTG